MGKTLFWIAGLGLGFGVLLLSVAAMTSDSGMDFMHGMDMTGDTPIAQGPDSRSWTWDGGDRLEVDLPASVRLTPGPSPKIIVHGPQNLIDRVAFANGRLTSNRGGIHSHRKMDIEVQGVSLKEIDVSGVAQVNLGHLDQDRMEVSISGAGDVVGDGHVGKLEVDISGAGDARLGKLAADDAEIHLSGAGNAEIAPSQSADVHISGVGGVQLATKPKTLTSHISGLGSVDGPGSD
jgi:hypothetical protein